jgi:hypothetical protein
VLAKAIRCPLISRDAIKEGYLNTLKNTSASDSDITRHVYETFFSTIEFLLEKRISLVIEAAFQHKVWQPKLESLQAIAYIRIVHCAIDAQSAKTRFIERSLMDVERVQYHDDLTVEASREAIEHLIENYEPPQMDVPTLHVNTADGYQPAFDEIVLFAHEPLSDALE